MRELQGRGLPAFASLACGNRHAQLCLAFYVGAGGGESSELEHPQAPILAQQALCCLDISWVSLCYFKPYYGSSLWLSTWIVVFSLC